MVSNNLDIRHKEKSMSNKNYAPVCGIYCAACNLLGKECAGCGYVKGKPFWVAAVNIDICPIYDCCMNTQHLEHCGICGEFPCKIFLNLRDPAMSEAEFQKSLRDRKKLLERRTQIGTEAWLIEISDS